MPDQNDAAGQQRGAEQGALEAAPADERSGHDPEQPVSRRSRMPKNREQEVAAKAKETDDTLVRATRTTAWATVAIFFANVVFAFFAYQQWITSRDVAQAQIRPYVVIRVKNTSDLAEGTKVTIPLDLENVGNTPVYRGKLYPAFEMTTDLTTYQFPGVGLTPGRAA